MAEPDDTAQQTPDNPVNEMSIHVVSMNLEVGPPFIHNPNHNFISFRDANGQELFAMHGLSVDRETGNVVSVGDNDDTLRVFLVNKEAYDIQAKLQTEGETEIFRGTADEVLQKLVMANDAANFINEQNLVYDAVEPFRTAQNSNSVAHTLVQAMELEFPEEIERYWAPGHERILLPEGWRSEYADPNLPEAELINALNGVIQNMSIQAIVAEVLEDETPADERNKFFRRDEPFEPYAPVGGYIANAPPTPDGDDLNPTTPGVTPG